MSSHPGSLSVSFTQESSCSLRSKDNFYYYLHNTTGTLHFYALQLILYNGLTTPSLGIPIWGGDHKMSPAWITPLKTTLGVLTLPLILFLDFCNINGLRSNFQSVELHLSSTKPHLLFLTETQLPVTTDSSPFLLFPPTFSLHIFNPKLTVAHMCVTTLLTLVCTILNLQNFLPSG